MPFFLAVLPSVAAVAAFRFLRRCLTPPPHLPIPPPPLISPSTKPFSTNRLSSSSGTTMDGHRPSTLLLLAGKSAEENDLAQSLKSKTETLKLGGEEEEIRILLQHEMDSITPPTFNSQLYMDALSTSLFGRLLIWSPRLSSTHDLVSQNFSELPLGTVCITDIQFKGRGRAKNAWDSPEGCLLFSFTLQMEDGRKLPLLQYVVSLAVTEAINESCRAKGLPQLDVRIKWPNDLYLDGLKVGGILCTSTYRSKKFNVCSGIGLNLDNEKPTTCLNTTLQKWGSGTNRLTREDILAAFFNSFENLYEIFLIQGFQVLEELYYKTWLHSGQKVIIEEQHEGKSVEQIVVTVQGLTSSGYLLATDEDKKSYELHPDGNSFDFFKGLVRRKLG
ncbi:biotin--protein ligase 2-like isoform X2 [Phoenix dactylifera]|uniref:Biotin--protein ligase 2-like isoform X2 n=1 Tax=Phoenix dactylifera TaxID=42345 RepID=A0A8B7CVR0_PHODC|nr:biotin--protein ligase 2-like isoform X2 [Phoenix dactylifera]XP_008807176.2 biotin--protein ligase 2-like isoform X2 [Phoenix dactylifera]